MKCPILWRGAATSRGAYVPFMHEGKATIVLQGMLQGLGSVEGCRVLGAGDNTFSGTVIQHSGIPFSGGSRITGNNRVGTAVFAGASVHCGLEACWDNQKRTTCLM